jgi:hypothetical protein
MGDSQSLVKQGGGPTPTEILMGEKQSHNKDGGPYLTEIFLDNQTPLKINRKAEGDYWDLQDGKINADKDEVGRDIPKEVEPWECKSFFVSGRNSTDVGPRGGAYFTIGRTGATKMTLQWDNGTWVKCKGYASLTEKHSQQFMVLCDVNTTNAYKITFRIYCKDAAPQTEEEVKEMKEKPGILATFVTKITKSILEVFKNELPTEGGVTATALGQTLSVQVKAGLAGSDRCAWNGHTSRWIGKDGFV